MILPKIIGKKEIIPSITTVLLIVLLYSVMLSTLDNIPFLDATIESVLFFLNATVRILSAWLVALAITWFFVSLSTRVNLENEFFGGKPSRIVQYLFSIFGSFLLFVTAFEYLHTKINIISLDEKRYQLIKLVDISTLINLNPTSAIAFAVIFFVFSYSIVIFMYALVSHKANSDEENLSESFLGTFLLLTVYIVLGVVLPILWIYYPEMQNMLSWWDFVRIYGVLFAIGLMIHYFFTKKIKVVSMMDELKKRADEFKQLLRLSDSIKDNKNVPLGVFLSRRDLEPLVDNKENFANLNFALTFASKSFLIAIFMPLLLSNISMIFVFGVFLISGAFVWIESIKLGGSVSPSVKYIPKEKNISDLEPIKINGTSIMISAFLDSLFSLDGYLTMGIIGALLFSGLATLEAAKNIPFFYWYLFPQDFLVAFAALVAAFILAFGLDSLAKRPHVLLFILGLVSIGPQIFKIILLYLPIITNVEIFYFVFVVLMIFVIIFFVGRTYPPLKEIKYTKIRILAPRNVSILPIVHEKNQLSKFAEIEYVESPFVIYREMISSFNMLTGRPDAIILDYLTYLTLKLSKKLKYTAVMQLGTSGYSLLVPKHMIRRMIYEKLKRSIGKIDGTFFKMLEDQVKNYNEEIEKFTNPYDEALKRDVDKVIKEVVDYLLKENQILVAIPSVQPLARETLLESIIKYVIANLLDTEANRLGIPSHIDDFLRKIVLTPTTPEQIRSTAYLFDLILLAEPYVSWLTLAVNDEKAIARVLWDSSTIDASLLRLVKNSNSDLDAGFYGGLPPHVLAVDDRLIKKAQEILRKEDNENEIKKKLKIYMNNPSVSMFKGFPLSLTNKVYPLLAIIKIISEREFSYFVSRLCKVNHNVISPDYLPSLQLKDLWHVDASKPLSIGIDYIAHLITGIRDKKRLMKKFSNALKDITNSEYILSLLATIYSYCAIQLDVTTNNGKKSYIMSTLCNESSASILKMKARKIFNYILSDAKYGNMICDPTFIERIKGTDTHNRIRRDDLYRLIIKKLGNSNVVKAVFDDSVLKSSSAIQSDLIQLINNFNTIFNPYSLSNFAAEFIIVSFLQSSWIEPHLSKRTLVFQSPLLGCSMLMYLLYKMLGNMINKDVFKPIQTEIKNIYDTLSSTYMKSISIINIDCSKSRNVIENEYTNQLYSRLTSDTNGVGMMICNLLEKMREKCIVYI